jgi:hypothetical protein
VKASDIRAKIILIAVLLVALAGPWRRETAVADSSATQAQQPSASAGAAPSDPSAGVEITAQALPANKFCGLGADGYVVYVPLDITVANGRRTPIILTRFLHIQRVLLGKTPEDVLAQKYELATPVRAYRSFGEAGNFGPSPSDDAFVVLKHNQTYEFTAVEGIPVRNNPSAKVAGTAYPGQLAMSIEIQTWPFFRESSGVRRDWGSFGDLISTPVISYPTLIKLVANPTVEKCGLLAP